MDKIDYKLEPSWLGIINWSKGLPLSKAKFNNELVIFNKYDYWADWVKPYNIGKEYRNSFPVTNPITNTISNNNHHDDIENGTGYYNSLKYKQKIKRIMKKIKRCEKMKALFNPSLVIASSKEDPKKIEKVNKSDILYENHLEYQCEDSDEETITTYDYDNEDYNVNDNFVEYNKFDGNYEYEFD
jgi:hypothetical protein